MKRQTRDVAASLIGASLLVGGVVIVGLIVGDAGESAVEFKGQMVVQPSVDVDNSAAATAPPSSPTSASNTTSTSSSSTTGGTTTTMPFTGDEGMSISHIESTESDLWETATGECSSNPQTAVVSATVLVPSGVSGVVVGWGVDAPDVALEWVEMVESAPDVYSATIGPFPEDTLDSGGIEPVLVAIEAGDASGIGVLADPPSFLLLHDCETES